MIRFVILTLALFSLPLHAEEMIELPESCIEDVMSMIRCPLDEDIGVEDAAESMKLRANFLNFKLVAYMPLSEEVKAQGGESNHMEIFQFCDATIAAKMVQHNMVFAGFLPCRIALLEDDDGQGWLVTMNMDTTMLQAGLPADLNAIGLQVRNNIYNIMGAGVVGDL